MRVVVLVTVLLLAFALPASAFHLGPATPAADHGKVNFGIGYFFYQAELNGFEVEQNRGYLHLGYGLGMEDEPRWEAFIRGGVADMEASSEGFDADFEPFANVGLKGAFWDGPRFGWGMVLQGGVFGEFEDNGAEVEDFWEIEVGFPVQMKTGPFLFYAGPVFYRTEADEIDEDDAVGGFGGVGLSMGNMRFELEGQIRSDISAGGFFSVQF